MPFLFIPRPGPAGILNGHNLLLGTACFSLGLAAHIFYTLSSTTLHKVISSPRRQQELGTRPGGAEDSAPPYPADVLPGGRDVESPYGTIRVFEWGPETGERVILVHGISTPQIALGDLAHELANRGYRVMTFDLFGRGYSDAPSDLPYDSRLYTSQILLVLSSSSVPWVTEDGFHLVGYSLGGGLSVAFTRYLPHLVRSLTLIASCGLIRAHHRDWRGRILYTSGLLPQWLVKYLVRRRIRPRAGPPRAASGTDIIAAESKRQPSSAGTDLRNGDTPPNERSVSGDGDANGGAGFDSAMVSKYRPGVTVSSIVRWQIDNHEGFMGAFVSTMRNAPIYAPQDDWVALSSLLRSRRDGENGKKAGLVSGKILIVLGEDDPVIVKGETMEDALATLGPDGVDFAIIPGGHEIPITRSCEVAQALISTWDH